MVGSRSGTEATARPGPMTDNLPRQDESEALKSFINRIRRVLACIICARVPMNIPGAVKPTITPAHG